MNDKEKRVESILDSLSDEAVSVLWAWMELAPFVTVFDQMTKHISNRGISPEEAVGELDDGKEWE